MRKSCHFKSHVVGIASLICAALLLGAGVIADESSNPPLPEPGPPPGAPAEFRDGAITAVVVRSWVGNPDEVIWDYLNENWNLFGDIEIQIDYTSLGSVDLVLLEDLEAVGADVVIVSDTAGSANQWSQAEVEGLQEYGRQGHNLLGTFLLYRHSQYDNRLLAPLWGHRPEMEYGTVEAIENSSHVVDPAHCLFTGVGYPMDLGGFPEVQIPQDDLSWDVADMNGATILARSLSGRNVVTSYDAGSHWAHYISYMPEYQDGSDRDAAQFLYNAIVCDLEHEAVPAISGRMLPLLVLSLLVAATVVLLRRRRTHGGMPCAFDR